MLAYSLHSRMHQLLFKSKLLTPVALSATSQCYNGTTSSMGRRIHGSGSLLASQRISAGMDLFVDFFYAVFSVSPFGGFFLKDRNLQVLVSVSDAGHGSDGPWATAQLAFSHG